MMKKIFTCLVLLFAVMANVNATVIWEGNVSYVNGKLLPEGSTPVTIDASKFSTVKEGDLMNIKFAYNADDQTQWQGVRLCVPESFQEIGFIRIAQGDNGSTVYIDASLLARLKENGLALNGSGYTVTSISLDAPHDGILWEGQKVVSGSGWTVGMLPTSQFANVAAGCQLVITGKKTGNDARCVLRSQGSNWPELPADVGNSSTFTSFNDTGETTFTFSLNADAAQALKENGLIVDGNAYTLLSVALKTTATSIRNTEVSSPACKGVYTLSGAKVSDKAEGFRLPQGLYIVNGKCIVIR